MVLSYNLGREFMPPEHWSYSVLFRFEALGLVRLPSQQPFSRDDVRQYVAQIESNLAAGEPGLSARDSFNLDRLRMEFGDLDADSDPKTRWDPPLVYAEDPPLFFEGDLDLSLVPTNVPIEPQTGEQWEVFGVTNIDARLHLREWLTYELRYRITAGPEEGNRVRDEKPTPRTKSFKGVTSLYERSYIIFRWKPLTFNWGRDYVDWGPSEAGNLHVSQTARSLDNLGGQVRFKNLRLSFLHAQLWPDPQRYLSGHRLEMRFADAVFGLSETVLYTGRGIDPTYALPLSSFYANQFNERGDDNVVWSLDAKYQPWNGVLFYGSYLIDDFQFERDDGTPDKTAFDIGARAALIRPLPSMFRVRYRFVDIYTYSHRDTLKYHIADTGDIASGAPPLGALLGPDADQLTLLAELYPWRSVISTLGFSLERRGEGNDYRPFIRDNDPNPTFPSGVVEKTYAFDLAVRWELDRYSFLRVDLRHALVKNRNHQSVDDEWDTLVRIQFKWDLGKRR